MNYLLYILIIGWTVCSCMDTTVSIVKTIVEPLPPSSMDSTLLVGDYLFVNMSDSENVPIPVINE